MPNDPLRFVTQGQRIDKSAARENALTEAARWVRRHKNDGGTPGAIGDEVNPSLTALIRNDTGAGLDEFSVLRITDWLISPVDRPFEVQDRPAFAGATPNATTNLVVVTQEPISDGGIGLATLAGHAVVDILVNDSSHEYATPINGDNTKLTSAATGPIRIIKWETSGSTRRAEVLLLNDAAATAGIRILGGTSGDISAVTKLTVGNAVLTGTAADATLNVDHNLLSGTHDDTLAGSVVLGDIIYGNATPLWQRLAGNTTTTKKFLTETGTGAASAAPTWSTIEEADISSGLPAVRACRVYGSSHQSVGVATTVTLAFDGEEYDTHGFHDNATNNSRLIIPAGESGKYRVGFALGWSTSSTHDGYTFSAQIDLTSGGVTTLVALDQNNAHPSNRIETELEMSEGDYVEVKVFHGYTGGAISVGSSYFAGAGRYSPVFWLSKIGGATTGLIASDTIVVNTTALTGGSNGDVLKNSGGTVGSATLFSVLTASTATLALMAARADFPL